MRQLGNQLDDIDNLVCEVMCNKFVSLAIQWEDPAAPAHNASNTAFSALSQSTYCIVVVCRVYTWTCCLYYIDILIA